MIRIFSGLEVRLLLTFNIIALSWERAGVSQPSFSLLKLLEQAKRPMACQRSSKGKSVLRYVCSFWDQCYNVECGTVSLKKTHYDLARLYTIIPYIYKKFSHKCSWSKHLAVFCTSFFICWKIVLTFGPDGPLVGPLLDPRLFCFIWARFEEL